MPQTDHDRVEMVRCRTVAKLREHRDHACQMIAMNVSETYQRPDWQPYNARWLDKHAVRFLLIGDLLAAMRV